MPCGTGVPPVSLGVSASKTKDRGLVVAWAANPDMFGPIMNNLLKKTVLSAVGAAVVTSEKAQAALDEIVRRGKIDAEDARVMAEKIARQGRKEFEAMSRGLGGKIKETIARFDEPARARIAELEARIKALEKKQAVRPSRARKA